MPRTILLRTVPALWRQWTAAELQIEIHCIGNEYGPP